MRVLLVNQFYPPDVAPTGRYLRDLAAALTTRGHVVDVLASRETYGRADRERDRPEAAAEESAPPGGVRVWRLGPPRPPGRATWQRGFGMASFWWRVARATPGSDPRHGWAKPDLILALTSPPFLALAAQALARRCGARLAHWVMDQYPDALVAQGWLRPRGWLAGRLRARVNAVYARSTLLVALGPHAARCLGAAWTAGDGPRIESVPLWAPDEIAEASSDEAARRTARTALGWADGDLVLLYSGNLGRAHRLGEFLFAAAALGQEGPRWVFAGGGARRPALEAFARARPEARLQLLPYAAAADLGARLAAADVHLASLDRAWQGVVVPSKVQAAFAVGRPLIFVGPDDNEAAVWIRAAGAGWVVGENQPAALLAALDAARDPAERARRGQAALRFARRHFSRDHNCARLVALLEMAAGGAGDSGAPSRR